MSTSPLLEELGRRVRELRRERGMTQHDLADASGVSLRFLGQIESGDGNVSLSRLAEVARGLSVSVVALLGGASPAEEPALALARELLAQRTPAEVEEALGLARALLGVAEGTRVALLGIRGAGKSSVGRRLSKRLAVPFVELDALVEERAGMPLASVFELHGEDYYRGLERQALLGLLSSSASFVVATGGSIVTRAEEYEALKRSCVTVWLRADPEHLWERVVSQGDARPMRENPRAMEQLRAMSTARAPLYGEARVIVDTPGRTVDEVAREIAARVRAGDTAALARAAGAWAWGHTARAREHVARPWTRAARVREHVARPWTCAARARPRVARAREHAARARPRVARAREHVARARQRAARAREHVERSRFAAGWVNEAPGPAA